MRFTLFRSEDPRGRSATHRTMMALVSRRGNSRHRPSHFQPAVFGNTSVPRRSSKHRSTFFSCWTKQACDNLANSSKAGLAGTARSAPGANQFLHKPRVKVLCLEVLPPLAFGGDLLEAWGVLLLAVNSHDFYVISREFGERGAQYGVLWRSNFNFFYGRGGG